MHGQLFVTKTKKEAVTGDGAEKVGKDEVMEALHAFQVTKTSFLKLLGSKCRLSAKHFYACLDVYAAGKMD